jgi:predicted aminopeptidase
VVPLAAYNELVSGFAGLFAQAEESWPLFYTKVIALGASAPEARTAELTRLGREQRTFEHDAESSPVLCAALRF